MGNYEFWFITGSQSLYGEETLRQVAENSSIIVDELNKVLPYPVINKAMVKTCEGATEIIKEANYNDHCIGIITFCHTFSPSKMWINGLALLQKPWCHLHTQFNRSIPNEAIDMDYMNLHQSAHGDREHGYIGTRLGRRRKVIAGYWGDEAVKERLIKWQRAAVGVAVSQTMKVMRFGDNMREVAVTEGDKVEAQFKFGWQVNTFPVGELVEIMAQVGEAEIDEKMKEYRGRYEIAADVTAEALTTIGYQARTEIAIRKMMEREQCQAFTNTFEDLYGMEQLPGLATQNLMADGYGYGGEGDWKTSAMTAIIKAMGNASSFMEDYTYDLADGIALGAHMLEVCPSIAVDRPRIEIHPLGIGKRKAPARLVFEGQPGNATATTLIDLGTHFRMIVQDIVCVKPTQTMPNLPVARVMWKPLPDLTTGAECWIMAGGAHHTVLSYGVDAEVLRDWARMMNIEFVHIGAATDPVHFERELLQSEKEWCQG